MIAWARRPTLVIKCELDKPLDQLRHLLPVAMRANDAAKSVIDLVIFATGNGHSFVIETFTDPNGAESFFVPQDPSWRH